MQSIELLLGAVQMLVHMGQGKAAEKVHNAWLKTIEDGIHTYDIYQEGISKKKVGTKEFAFAVCQRMGEEPSKLAKASYAAASPLILPAPKPAPASQKDLPLDLQMISNRGVKVWPHGLKETFCTDHWRCRMTAKDGDTTNPGVIWMLLRELSQANVDVIKTENLYLFTGEKGFSLGQGQ